MRFRRAIERIPGGMFVVLMVLGALVNTLDQAHLAAITGPGEVPRSGAPTSH